MRRLPTLLLLLLLAACGRDSLTVHGTLLPGSDATDVYVVGQPLRGRVVADSFSIAGVRGQVVELEFAEGNESLGRMRIEAWSDEVVAMRGIWIEDGVAYPTALRGASAATVNEMRMAGAAALPRNLSAEAVVLAASGRGDALIVRPLDARLPDLRVVLTPGTAVELEGSAGAVFDELRFGDSLRVEGTVEAGYLVATRLLVYPRSASEEVPLVETEELLIEEASTGRAEDDDDGEEDEVEEEDDRQGPRSLVRPGGGRGRGRGIQRRRD